MFNTRLWAVVAIGAAFLMAMIATYIFHAYPASRPGIFFGVALTVAHVATMFWMTGKKIEVYREVSRQESAKVIAFDTSGPMLHKQAREPYN